MTRRHKKGQKSQANLQELMVVTFADDMDQAKDYETLLKNNDIPVLVKEHYEQSASLKGIAILVPEDFIDEAHVVIESQDTYDDLCEFTLEDDGNFDDEPFDDYL